MHTLKVTLRQHTPLIHFQHDQEGATLRASEVKPKLDKFIWEKLSDDERKKGKEEGWIKEKNDKRWLDYQMRIEAMNFLNISIPKKPFKKHDELQKDIIGRQLYVTNNYPDNNTSLLMSNIGGRITENLFNFSIAENIQIRILYKDNRLKKPLTKFLNEFFNRTNFGNRESKGFGSFEVTSINGKDVNNGIESDSYIISFTLNPENVSDKETAYNAVYKDVFRIISKFWKSMKYLSGVKGKSAKNVLLKIRTQDIGIPERIPSPILFKPYLDFWEENSIYNCDVTIAILFDKKVIKRITGSENTRYYKDKIEQLMRQEGNNLYSYLTKVVESKVDKQSIKIE